MGFHLFRIVQPVLFVIIAGLVPDYSLACDYQRVDPSHTMCVYHPRSCAGKTLIRKYICMLQQLILNSVTEIISRLRC